MYDVFINNPDRFPAGVWRGAEGNYDNIRIQNSTGDVYIIDSNSSLLEPETADFQKYKETCLSVLQEALSSDYCRTRTCLTTFLEAMGLKVDDAAWSNIQSGMRACLDRIIS